MVVEEMRKYPYRYMNFVDEWDLQDSDETIFNCTYFEFLDRMEKKGEWGANATLVAAANACGRNFQVVTFKDSKFHSQIDVPTTTRDPCRGDDIWLVFVGQHYRSTEFLDGYSAQMNNHPESELKSFGDFDFRPKSTTKKTKGE